MSKPSKLIRLVNGIERSAITNTRLGLAQVLFEQRSIEEAIAEFEGAYALDRAKARDGLIKAREALANTLEKEGRVNEADQEYETILRIAPRDQRVRKWVADRWATRGRKYFGEKRYEEAVAEYEKAVALDISGAWEGLIAARRTWAEALEREDKADEADRQYEAILSIAPDDDKLKKWVASCWMTRGKKYLKGKRYEDAVAEYDKAVALDVPGAWEGLIAARRTWAEALEREDKASEADQQYETILSIAPDDARVREWVANSLIRRGDRYLEKGRYDEASKVYDQAEDIQPEKQPILSQRRRQLELVPDYDKAMRAHKAGDWVTAEKEWLELYRKDRDYARREGKTVAVLLAEAIEKREGIAKRRQRRLILVSSSLAVMVAVLILWLGWGSVATSGQIGAGPMALVVRTAPPIAPPTLASLPTNTPYPTYTPQPTYTSYPTLSPYPTYTPYPTPATSGVPATLTMARDTPTPKPTPTPVIIVVIVTATPAPTPTPTPLPAPRFPTPQLIGPENGRKFFEGDAVRIILQWESVGPLAENEWYQVVLVFFKSAEVQYQGNRIKETKWLIPEYLYHQADQPERPYYWNVTVVQVDQDPDGKETSIARSPQSETWVFYWP
jgi:tetratricopeptide (TPR) repeat protein